MPNPYTNARRRVGAADGPVEILAAIFIVFVVVAFIVAFIGGCVLLGGLIFQQVWNYGVVALVAACGGTVAKIGFWVGVVGNLALQIVLSPFRRQQEVTVSK